MKETPEILIDISTAIMRVDGDVLQCRMVEGAQDETQTARPRLPFGPFMPNQHRTMEIGLRHWVREQVEVDLGHVEQLYTFADQGRQSQQQQGPDKGAHTVSVGYLALTNQSTAKQAGSNSLWQNIYRFFPWEDWRQGRPACLDDAMMPALDDWLQDNPDAQDRVRLAFGRNQEQWDEEFVLERYEILYEAGLMEEAYLEGIAQARYDSVPGVSLQLDHRRILATALGRLRGKFKYRPVIFDLMPAQFTLTQLQKTAEAILGVQLHKQNFRRMVEKSNFLNSTGQTEKARGRPAELFRFRHGDRADRPLSGLRISSSRPRRV
jgi:hypothetical protein